MIVLAKQPLAGHSKTRLARDVGLEKGQVLAEAFVLDTLDFVSEQTQRRLLVAYSPAEAEGWFASKAPTAELYRQPEVPFGARVCDVFRRAFRQGAKRCVLIGTDTPQLPTSTLEYAFEALHSTDVCIGPASDGGYYLIGLRQDQPRLFEDIPWSTRDVRSVTLQRAQELELSVAELAEEMDADEGSDLPAVWAALKIRPSAGARTRVALREVLGFDH